jgi:hypothetical protein
MGLHAMLLALAAHLHKALAVSLSQQYNTAGFTYCKVPHMLRSESTPDKCRC